MYPSEIFEKKILISPLNWGMGHVSRCIPLIKKLQHQNNKLIIACSKVQREIIEAYVDSDVLFAHHDEYPFYFNGNGNFLLDSLLNLRECYKRHEMELFQVDELVKKFNAEIIISDHRYGFRNEKCISIFMTHQLHLPLPWHLKLAQLWHKNQILKFDYQWIVDDKYKRLAGKLSDNKGFKNSRYIGLLSRFNECNYDKKTIYNGILIVSGPMEYYPSLFQSFKRQLSSGEIDLIVGNDKAYEVFKTLNTRLKFHHSNDWNVTDKIMMQSKKIFGFCGYSTLMDLNYLGCDAELIACRGQLEQLYLQKKVLRNSGLSN
jgi:hypothetical protein